MKQKIEGEKTWPWDFKCVVCGAETASTYKVSLATKTCIGCERKQTTTKLQKIDGGEKCTCDDTPNDAYCPIHGQFAESEQQPKQTNTMKQKIEGGWEERFDEQFEELVEEEYNNDWISKRESKWVYVDRKEKVKSFISNLLASERQRIVNGLFKPNHRYIVWLDGHELKVLDEASIKIK